MLIPSVTVNLPVFDKRNLSVLWKLMSQIVIIFLENAIDVDSRDSNYD